jgi:hypothetical protein
MPSTGFRPGTWANPGPLPLDPRPPRRCRDRRCPPDLPWRRTLAHDLAASQRLAHLVGVNGFFTGLLCSTRTRPGCSLEEWWSERRCASERGVARPDGYGIWTDSGVTLPFLLEHDNGTEPLNRLTGKLDGYRRLAHAACHSNWGRDGQDLRCPRVSTDRSRGFAFHRSK